MAKGSGVRALCHIVAVVLLLQLASALVDPAGSLSQRSLLQTIPSGWSKINCNVALNPAIGIKGSSPPGKVCGVWYDEIACKEVDGGTTFGKDAIDICCAKDPKGMGFGKNGEADVSKCITKGPGKQACTKVAGFTQKICCVAKACTGGASGSTTKPAPAPAATAAVPAGFKKVSCNVALNTAVGMKDSSPPGKVCGLWYDAMNCGDVGFGKDAMDVCCAKDPKGMGFGRDGTVDVSKCITKAAKNACSKIAGYTEKICCAKKVCTVS